MGATVTVSREVAAFQAANGEIFYVLVEGTYEKNCHPHTPHRSVCGFGRINSVMRHVLLSGSACEGGDLQRRNGWISPESYIGYWRDAFKRPVGFADVAVSIECRDGSYRRPEDRHREAVNRHLGTEGLALDENGKIDLALYTHAPLVEKLLLDREATGLSAWMVIERTDMLTLARPDLAYLPGAGDVPLDLPKVDVLRLGNDGSEPAYLVRVEGRPWRNTGWAYSTVQRFVENVVLGAESASPGCAEKLIREFRQKVSSAPGVPMDTGIVIRAPQPTAVEPDDRFNLLTAREICAACDVEVGGATTLRQIRGAGQLGKLGWLRDGQIEYLASLPQPALF